MHGIEYPASQDLPQSELSEICAVIRTRLPKDVRAPATRGGTVPMTTQAT